MESGANFDKTIELPIEDGDGKIGVVAEPSGSGKTGIGKVRGLYAPTCAGGKTVHQHFGTATTSKAWDASQIRAKLTAAQARLRGVFIENEPWARCFKRYDREHTFFYTDPPYWQTVGYDHAFDWLQYELLTKAMAESKGKFMLSINDHPDIRELFKDFRITQPELAYTVGRDKTGKTSG
ncbi:DNA adenine methylase [Neisseria basseii]|uniref:DNA adenine methylase n=1 Tax=Neisseria basseii TaxID=2830650 RepID=UPI002657D59A|nr:DNA adenine methylase [Neisseria basseii]